MTAIILAAGYGTRLYAIVKDTPKALLPISDRPLANYIIDRIEKISGLKEVIVVTNNKFYKQFCDWTKGLASQYPFHFRVVNDGTNTPEERLGSIGDIDFTLRQAKISDDVLVVGGDNLFDFNVQDYIAFARSKPHAVSMGLYDIGHKEEATKFGVAALDPTGKITSFEEKPAQPKSSLVAMCFYYLPKATLPFVGEYLAEVKKSDTAGDYIRWLREKKEVYGFTFSGKWYDIGSVEAYYEAQKAFGKN